MDPWVWWIVAAVVLGTAEVVTSGLVLAMLAGGAVAAALAAGAGADAAVQVLVFAAASLALLAGVRPVITRQLRTAHRARTGVDALVGAEAVVLARVDGADGRVKLAGEVWSARSYDGSSVIEPGARVQVLQIAGAHALVYPVEDPWSR